MRKHLFLLAALVAFCGANAQSLYTNATPAGLTQEGLRTSPRGGGGDYSEVQPGNSFYGVNVIGSLGIRLGDDFTIADPAWDVTSVSVFAYQIDVTSPTFNGGTLEIRSGSETGAVVGTGTFSSASFTDIYRVASGFPDDARRVQKVTFDVNTSLAAGNYWLTYDLANPANNGFVPLLTKVGSLTTPGANSKQFISNTWVPITELTNGLAQDLPFYIDGEVVPEPASMAVLAAGVLALARKRRK